VSIRPLSYPDVFLFISSGYYAASLLFTSENPKMVWGKDSMLGDKKQYL
jgi:hypothetical protein